MEDYRDLYDNVIVVNADYEKYKMFFILVEMAVKEGGEVRGGAVKDYVIATRRAQNINNVYRTYIPDSMSVYFKCNTQIHNFKKKVRKVLRSCKTQEIFKDERLEKHVISVACRVGGGFLRRGTRISMRVEAHLIKGSPRNSYFITNSLIVKKDVYSVYLDVSDGFISKWLERDTEENVIKQTMGMVVKKKTFITKNPCCEIKSVSILSEAVDMMKKGWEVTNLEILKKTEGGEDKVCNICLDAGPEVVMLGNSHLHYDCFLKYIKVKGAVYKSDGGFCVKGLMRESFKLCFDPDINKYIEPSGQ